MHRHRPTVTCSRTAWFAGQAAVIVAGVAANVVPRGFLRWRGTRRRAGRSSSSRVCRPRVAPAGRRRGRAAARRPAAHRRRHRDAPRLAIAIVARRGGGDDPRRDEGRRRPQAGRWRHGVRDGSEELRLLDRRSGRRRRRRSPPPLGVEVAAQCGEVRHMARRARGRRAPRRTTRAAGCAPSSPTSAQYLGGLSSGRARAPTCRAARHRAVRRVDRGARPVAAPRVRRDALAQSRAAQLAAAARTRRLPAPRALGSRRRRGASSRKTLSGAISGATALLFLLIAGSSLAAARGTPACRWRPRDGDRQILPSLVIGVALAQVWRRTSGRGEDAASRTGARGGNAHLESGGRTAPQRDF